MQALSQPPQIAGDTARNDLAKFASGWSTRDAKEFDDSTAMFNTIDSEMWMQTHSDQRYLDSRDCARTVHAAADK